MPDDSKSNTTWFGIDQSDQINELAKALAEFQAEVVTVGKAAENPFFKSRYADLGSIMKAALPVHAKHGLSVTQQPLAGELVTTLLHSSGQFMRSTMPLFMKDRATVQDYGSAISYARRYSYAAILGIVIDEDDDGNAASGKLQNSSKTATRPVDEPLSSNQLKQITDFLEEAGVDPSERGKYLTENFKVANPKKMTRKQAALVIQQMADAISDLGGAV